MNLHGRSVPKSVDRLKLKREKDGSFTRPEKRPETEGAGRARGHASTEPQRAPDSKKLTHTKHEMNQAELPMRLDLAWTSGRVGGLGQSHWPDTRPSLREPRKGFGPAKRGVSQPPVGSAAEDAGHSRKSQSRRDAPSLPACKSPTRGLLKPECNNLRPQLRALPEPCAEVALCEVFACPE